MVETMQNQLNVPKRKWKYQSFKIISKLQKYYITWNLHTITFMVRFRLHALEPNKILQIKSSEFFIVDF